MNKICLSLGIIWLVRISGNVLLRWLHMKSSTCAVVIGTLLISLSTSTNRLLADNSPVTSHQSKTQVTKSLTTQPQKYSETIDFVHPVSNPVYNDTANVKNQITVIYAHHWLPDRITTTAGKLPLGGDVNLVAAQLELKLNSYLSLVANKDGYVDFNPDATLQKDGGFGDLSAGLKWNFYKSDQLILSARGTFELPTGNRDVFQGNGSGNLSPALLTTYSKDKWQITSSLGTTVPFDSGEESTIFYWSLGSAYRLTRDFALQLEFNWFRVLDAGNGEANFDSQLGPTVPRIVQFEGGDYFNLGSSRGADNPDLVTLAFGATYKIAEPISVSAGYELPLTNAENSLTDGRVYAKAIVRF